MGVGSQDPREVRARIVYFGPPGAGTTANLRYIHKKLRKEHRGELRQSYARGTAGPAFEFLPVQLGSVRGLSVSLDLYTVPGGPGAEEARRRLLDGVDGIVFVADVRPERHEATLAALRELERHLGTFSRALADVILVVQYNHRDAASETALEKLHRSLALKPAAVFEASAPEGSGVLQTLTSLSKLILARVRRDVEEAAARTQRSPESEVAVEAEESREFDGPLSPAVPVDLGETPRARISLAGAGPVASSGGELRIPIRLRGADGREVELVLRLSLDAG
jgi:signal recognition particle receptor subunit beta